MKEKIDNIVKKYNEVMQDKRVITLLLLIQGLFYIFMPKGSLEWDARMIIGAALLYILGLLIEYFTKENNTYMKFINFIVFITFLILIFLFIKIDIVIRIFDRILGLILLILGIYNIYKCIQESKKDTMYYLTIIFSISLIIIGLLFVIKPIELGVLGIRIIGVILSLDAIKDFVSIYKKKGK